MKEQLLKKTKEKRIPKNCKIWNIGKYEVVALNRKNAIRKALNLRKRDFHCANE